MANIFLLIYPLVALSNLCAFLPQILKLVNSDSIEGISLVSWVIWLTNSSISLGYGLYHLNDMLFVSTQSLSVICNLSIVSIFCYKSLKQKTA